MKQLQTQEEYLQKITNDFTNELLDANTDLIKAIDNEDYEVAAAKRDLISKIISQTTEIFMTFGYTRDILNKHFNEQNEWVFSELNKHKDKYIF